MSKGATENQIQDAILGLLTAMRIFHYRNNSGAYQAEHGSYIRYGAQGSPDIIMVVNGIYIGLEVKREGEKQKSSQIAFQASLEKAGGKYHIVRSVDDVIKILKKPPIPPQ